MSETMIDYESTIYNALSRAMVSHPYVAVRMHPDTATAFTTLPSPVRMTLIVDDSVEPGQFRFEYEVAATLRATRKAVIHGANL